MTCSHQITQGLEETSGDHLKAALGMGRSWNHHSESSAGPRQSLLLFALFSLPRTLQACNAHSNNYCWEPCEDRRQWEPSACMGNPTCETACRGGGQRKVWKQNMERKNAGPPCYMRSLQQSAYHCKQNQCLFAATSSLSLPLHKVCKGLIDRLLQSMQNGQTPFLWSVRMKKVCQTPPHLRNVFAWWPQHWHGWEALHRVPQRKRNSLGWLKKKSDLFKAKGVKDYLLNLPKWLQTSWKADFIIIILCCTTFKRMRKRFGSKRMKTRFLLMFISQIVILCYIHTV